jgi:hypothetical protein
MNTAMMTEGIAKASPRFTAPDVGTPVLAAPGFRVPVFRTPGFRTKTAGVLYQLSVLTAAFAEVLVRGRLNVSGALIAVSGMIAITLLFYATLSPLSKRLALLAASFNLVGLTFELLRLQPQGVNLAVVFNGFYCILIGYIVFRSTFLPRILGGLITAGGLGWLTFLASSLAHYLSPYNLALGLFGEGLAMLWLVVMGVNVQPWNEQAAAAGVASSVAAAAAPSSDLLHI